MAWLSGLGNSAATYRAKREAKVRTEAVQSGKMQVLPTYTPPQIKPMPEWVKYGGAGIAVVLVGLIAYSVLSGGKR